MGEILKYPLDPTGIKPTNLVQGEQHTLVNRPIRCIATEYGGYYANSMIITDVSTGLQLNSNQWYPGELYTVPTAKFGQPVYGLVVITDSAISSNVSIQYQAVGGEYGSSETALFNLIDSLALDNRPVAWPDIILKPDQYPPSEHLHDAGTVFGFEYVVHALDRIRSTMELGSAIYQDKIYQYIDAKFAELSARIDGLGTFVPVTTVIDNGVYQDTLYFTANNKMNSLVLDPNLGVDQAIVYFNQ